MAGLGERVGDNGRIEPWFVVRTTMARNFKSSDEGKEVVTADGDIVGTIERVSGSTAHVRPDDDLSQSIRRRLGWTEEGEEMYRLESSKVEEFAGDQVHLMENL